MRTFSLERRTVWKTILPFSNRLSWIFAFWLFQFISGPLFIDILQFTIINAYNIRKYAVWCMKLNSRYLAAILTCRDWIIFLIAKLNIFIAFWFLGNLWLFDWNSGFPCGSAGKERACNVGDLGSIPGLGRSPGEGQGYPLQYSGLENSRDYTVHEVPKSWT